MNASNKYIWYRYTIAAISPRHALIAKADYSKEQDHETAMSQLKQLQNCSYTCSTDCNGSVCQYILIHTSSPEYNARKNNKHFVHNSDSKRSMHIKGRGSSVSQSWVEKSRPT